MNKFTVVWFAVGCHGYHEVLAESAHAAFANVANVLNASLRVSAKFRVFTGTPLRHTSYCMQNMTFID